MTDSHRRFMEIAVAEAAKCRTESGRVTPRVGAVIVRGDEVLAVAHRGELAAGEHAEYTVLERKCRDISIAGATVFTTLEPCTTRNPPKIPCVERLLERRIARVVIGMLDPNSQILGRGLLALRRANVEVVLFPKDLMAQLEELNRDFIRQQEELGRRPSGTAPSLPVPCSYLLLEAKDFFLGMIGTGRPGTIVETRVSCFQANLINLGPSTVRRIAGELRGKQTGQSYPLFLVRDGDVVPPSEIIALPPGHRAMITIPFDRENPRSPSRLQLSEADFLSTIPPFSVTVETEYGTDLLEVSVERCEETIRRFIEGDAHEGPIWRDHTD